jgi:hypothetical protein
VANIYACNLHVHTKLGVTKYELFKGIAYCTIHLAFYSASDWKYYRSTRKIISPPTSPGPAISDLHPADAGPLSRVSSGSANADPQVNLHALMRFTDGPSSQQSSQDEVNGSQDQHLKQQTPMPQDAPKFLDASLTTLPLGSTDPYAFYRVLGVAHTANALEIAFEYKKLVLHYHPDKHDDTEREMWTTQFQILTTIHSTLTNKEERKKYNRQCRTAKSNLERDRGRAAEPPANGARARESEAVPPPTAAMMHRSASNAASEVNAEPPPPYRARDHPATFAVMPRPQETMACLINEGKGCQDDLDNLFLLFDVYNTLNLRWRPPSFPEK